MSFTWPLALVALAAVPVLVALYIDRETSIASTIVASSRGTLTVA